MQPTGSRPSIISIAVILHPGKVLRWLFVIIGLLMVANGARMVAQHVLGHKTLFGLIRLFDVNGEANIPSMYSALALLFAGLLLAAIARAEALAGGKNPRAWAILAVIFVCLSVDEFSEIHEMAHHAMHYFANPTGFFYFAWVIPAMLFVAVLGLVYARFILQLPARIRLLAIVSAVVFVTGAIGFEMIGARISELQDENSVAYDLGVAVEEFLEMSGVAIWIYALLLYLSNHARPAPELHVSCAPSNSD